MTNIHQSTKVLRNTYGTEQLADSTKKTSKRFLKSSILASLLLGGAILNGYAWADEAAPSPSSTTAVTISGQESQLTIDEVTTTPENLTDKATVLHPDDLSQPIQTKEEAGVNSPKSSVTYIASNVGTESDQVPKTISSTNSSTPSKEALDAIMSPELKQPLFINLKRYSLPDPADTTKTDAQKYIPIVSPLVVQQGTKLTAAAIEKRVFNLYAPKETTYKLENAKAIPKTNTIGVLPLVPVIVTYPDGTKDRVGVRIKVVEPVKKSSKTTKKSSTKKP